MRKLFLLMVIIGAVLYWRDHGNPLDYVQNPGAIENPVYLEVRFVLENKVRSVEGVIFTETADQADCQRFADNVMPTLMKGPDQGRGLAFKIKSHECKDDLGPRYKGLFENEPNLLTYISAARGAPRERETRFISWGVSVEESDQFCEIVPQLQRTWKGKVSCIKALRS